DDYDKLADIAEKNGLNLVLSTISEVQPYWIEREIPDSYMVTNMGHKVISSNRNEIHFGITPGACFDHPEANKLMMDFIEKTVTHFKNRKNIAGWDCWNEIRWNVQADGYVCYCNYTVSAYRKWLEEKYGSLEKLNSSWLRRYHLWEDVFPGKFPPRPYTDMMAFQHFLTERTNRHAARRYELIKSIDPQRPVTIHGPCPCYNMTGNSHMEQALNRGNDWYLADSLDGVGCSNFPMWWDQPYTDYVMAMTAIASAARRKLFWVSELQGGRVGIGFDVFDPVPPYKQQKWVWEAVAHGASTILFWCWRDEVFGTESSGFGIIGNDGMSQQRLKGIGITAKTMKEYSAIFANYKRFTPKVGIFFSPQSYYLHFSQESNAARVLSDMRGYFKALTVKNIPCSFVEEEHLDELKDIKILFIPRANVMDDRTTEKLLDFVNEGGVIFCECETGAWDRYGIYRYPIDRHIALATGIQEIGRRKIEDKTIKVLFNKKKFSLKPTQWLCPVQNDSKLEILSNYDRDSNIISMCQFGKGRIIFCGTYLGNEYDKQRYFDFENFLEELIVVFSEENPFYVNEKSSKDFSNFTHVVAGRSGKKNLLFVFIPEIREKANLIIDLNFFKGEKVKDLLSGEEIRLKKMKSHEKLLSLTRGELGIKILIDT
ncbi:MAG TPA: beta-galactosidase, partial [Victivallales bacterium]|nr:beta-galactosidase [Victivallales bacterium]